MKKTKLFLAMVLGLCLLSGCAGKRDAVGFRRRRRRSGSVGGDGR